MSKLPHYALILLKLYKKTNKRNIALMFEYFIKSTGKRPFVERAQNIWSFRLCHSTGSQLQTSHHRGPGLRPGQSMWIRNEQCSIESLSSPLSTSFTYISSGESTMHPLADAVPEGHTVSLHCNNKKVKFQLISTNNIISRLHEILYS